MGHDLTATGSCRLLIKPPKKDQAGVATTTRWTDPDKCTRRGKAVHESHQAAATTPILSASPVPAITNTYRRFTFRPGFVVES
jgi:hypothetical protein